MSNNGTNNNIFKYFVAVGMLIGISILVFFIFKNMNKSSGDSGGSGSSGSLYDVDSIKAIAQKVFDDKMVGISINNGVITANAIKVTTVDTEWILIDRSGSSDASEVIAIKASTNDATPSVTTYYDNKSDGTYGSATSSTGISSPKPVIKS